jgi:hypothetical protein
VTVTPYESSYYEFLCSWLAARNIDIWSNEYLPNVGYITVDDTLPIAMGFLRMIEGNAGMIDALISNPESNPTLRNQAIDLVVTQLITKAKELKLSGLISFSSDENTLIRSEKFGFKIQAQQLIALKLEV